VLLAGLALPWLVSQLVVLAKSEVRRREEEEEEEEDRVRALTSDDPSSAYYRGDAVSRPGVEQQLIDALELPAAARDSVLDGLVLELEELGGTAINASSGYGRWVLPWVGGWQRLWTNSSDASFLGGPPSARFDSYSEISAREFIYGPGDGGMVIEYLFAAPGREKYLLSRAAGVTNLGDRYFRLDFPLPLQAYEVLSDADSAMASRACFQSSDVEDPACSYSGLKSTKPVQLSGAPTAPAALGLVLRTTYLSETLWIVRDKKGDKVAVFQRSPTQSVMDRRGLVMDQQLKPSENEQTRFGGLLFSDSDEYSQGWEAKKQDEARGQDRLLGK
jgi:hypothetical protein